MNQNYVAYVGNFLFPWGQAASRRVYGNALSLLAAGFNVRVASGDKGSGEAIEIPTPLKSGKLFATGLDLTPDQTRSQLLKGLRLVRDAFRKIPRWLDSQQTKPNAVILYGYHAPMLLSVKRWCARNKVPLFVDMTEWNEARKQTHGKFGLVNLNYEFSRRFLLTRINGAISVSEFLRDYFTSRSIDALCIPPTVDPASWSPSGSVEKVDRTSITIVYAGNPAGEKLIHRADRSKDLLASFILALEKYSNPKPIKLRILGPSVDKIQGIDLNSRRLNRKVDFVGRVPQQHIPGMLEDADFTVLLREKTVNATAGFPTKVVESLASSTPVICNYTSDLEKYVHDAGEGIILPDTSVESCAAALNRVALLSKSQLDAMKTHARERAETSFGYAAYASKLQALLGSKEIRNS